MPAIQKGRVCVFGAGGPVGAMVARDLAGDYELLLTDIAPIDEVLQRGTAKGFPAPKRPEPPHEWKLVDVTDYEQVEAAMRGCDGVINLTVSRSEPELAFRINVIGAYNIMKAATACRPKRIIHTGPEGRDYGYEGDYLYDFGITPETPFRPGSNLYPHTKHLSVKLVTVFAEQEGLDVITFLLSRLRTHEGYDDRDNNVMMTFSTAWDDLGPAFLAGLRAPETPNPNDVFYICSELPMGKFTGKKAKRLLGYEAKQMFERFYTRGARR